MGGESRRWSPPIWSLLLGALFLVSFAFLVVSATSGFRSLLGLEARHARWVALGLGLATLALAVYVGFTGRPVALRPRGKKNASDFFDPSYPWLYERQREGAAVVRSMGAHDSSRLLTVVAALVDPSRYRSRTTETVSLEERNLERETP